MTPTQLSEQSVVQLIDVRLADDYEATHIEGAVSNCVFEVAFSERLEQSAPDKDIPTVVYGANENSGEAEAAIEKLTRAGYRNINILEGGIERAIRENLPVVRGAALPEEPTLTDGSRVIDTAASTVEWLGKNLLNKHHGTAPIKRGELTFSEGILTGGEIIIDLEALNCSDLSGHEMHDVLISHLKNEDFFDVERHPEAILTIKEATQIEGTTKGGPNLQIKGDLNLKGQTHPIEFTASAGVTDDGKAAAQAAFAIDRTRWGVLYGSGKLFHRLAGHLVNDDIEFQIKIVSQ